MMSHVVYEGTARRAIIEGVPAAGKTGTTNAFRDAWFVGYTGNFIAGVWFGNDDYSSTNRMTGGSLPAMTWRAIMVAAHQGVEIKDIPGVTLGKLRPARCGRGRECRSSRRERSAGRPAAGADAARRRHSGAGREAARRGREGRGRYAAGENHVDGPGAPPTRKLCRGNAGRCSARTAQELARILTDVPCG